MCCRIFGVVQLILNCRGSHRKPLKSQDDIFICIGYRKTSVKLLLFSEISEELVVLGREAIIGFLPDNSVPSYREVATDSDIQ